MAKKQHSAFSLATSLGVAAMHTGITLWYRLPIMAAITTNSIRPADAVELNRMVSEKVAATSQGILAAQAEILHLATAAMAGKLELSDTCRAPLAIATATLKPALRTVKANSRRLRKRA
jgi:hypothetical protein